MPISIPNKANFDDHKLKELFETMWVIRLFEEKVDFLKGSVVMRKVLVVIDMQNDFIDGALGTKEAQAMLPLLVEKLRHQL